MNEVQVTLSYEAIEAMTRGEPIEVEVHDLEVKVTLTVNELAMRILRAQMAAVRLMYLPTPRTEH